MPVEHYENFPVASILMPARLRPAIEAIYAFARTADDLADEGDATAPERLAALTEYEKALDKIASLQSADSPLFDKLGKIVQEYRLPLQPFRDLLSAFKQDVETLRYDNFEQLLDYCHRSADPVGTLMLHLYGAATTENLRDSNAICSALQLINFWQDVAIDWKKPRVYLPQDDLIRFGVDENQLQENRADAKWRSLMHFQVSRARALMLSGAPLACRLPGRIGWELRLVVQGGLRILERIEAVDYDVFKKRPTLGKRDWVILVWRSITMKANN